MLAGYLDAAMQHATYEIIEDDNPYYGRYRNASARGRMKHPSRNVKLSFAH